MKPARRSLSVSQKLIVIERQNGRCACGCRKKLVAGEIHFDHALPLWLDGTNALENFRALIKKHHVKKTTKEAKVRAKIKRIKEKRLSATDKAIARALGQNHQPNRRKI